MLVGIGLLAALAAPALGQERTLTLMTHDSFFLPDSAIESFEAANDVKVELLPAGDAGSMVNQAILTADRPLADVLFGIDNTFLSRALEADIFEPYESAALSSVPTELKLDPEYRVTPMDVGDVCINLDRSAFGESGLPAPTSLEDLADCSTDDLIGWTERKKEKDAESVRHKGFLEGLEVGRAEAEDLILSARIAAGWISAEDLAQPEEENAEENAEGEAVGDEAGDSAAPAQA